MNRIISTTFLGSFCLAVVAFAVPTQSAFAQQATSGQRSVAIRSAEQWVRQLENELDHLEEDLYYERGNYPAGLNEQIDRASRAAAHFRQVLRRTPSQQHLMRDFQEMDQAVHQLVVRLEQSNDSWLRRQASRISYPDEQLHYVLQRMGADRPPFELELLARHAHALERESKNLQDIVERIVDRNDAVRGAIRQFANEATHFHKVIERGADSDHLTNDFFKVDQEWRGVVEQINRSNYGLYLRRNAQNVNRIHNQIYQLLTTSQASPPQVVPPSTRPALEFELPGIGRFTIPR